MKKYKFLKIFSMIVLNTHPLTINFSKFQDPINQGIYKIYQSNNTKNEGEILNIQSPYK